MVWHSLGKRAGAIPYRFESCTLRQLGNEVIAKITKALCVPMEKLL